MGDSCDEDNGSGPISRSSVTHVASIVAKFGEHKKELVREIGFGGILDMPHITKVDRKFTLWLLTKIDPENRCIIVNGEPVADLIDFEVARIMGIPCGSKAVCSLTSDDKKTKLQFIQNFIGCSDGESNSLTAAESIVAADYGLAMEMTTRHKLNFKVSFVVWVMGHLLAPTKKHNVGADRFWGALLDADDIKQFNWSAYVLDELINAARDVQDAIKLNKNINTITGCSILLQILYLESINMGSLNRPGDVLPRVKAYDAKSLNLMIAADKACSSSGPANATWGVTVRHLPEEPDEHYHVSINRPNNDANIKSPTENSIINDLGKYVRDTFGDKVTTAQSVALNWFQARCLSHYKQLRLDIQKDTIDLVGKLFDSTNVSSHAGPSEPDHSVNTAARPTRSEPSRPALSEPSRTILNNKRPYASSCTPYKRRNNNRYHVSFRHHDLPETLLSGKSVSSEHEVGEEQSDSEHLSRTGSHNSGFTIDAPSFDLGIELDTEPNEQASLNSRMNLLGSEQVASHRSNASTDINLSSSSPQLLPAGNITMASIGDSSDFTLSMTNEECAVPPTPGCFKALPGTPPSAKSITQPEFTTPDQKFRNCKTSPGSLSKILAEGDLVDRMLLSDDSPNLNIKPWDDGYSDGLIAKRLVGTPKMPESPWTCNLCHRIPQIDIIDKFFDDVSTCSFSILNRPWLAHTYPRHIEIDGIWIRQSFIPQSALSYDVCDLAVRRLKQLDETMYTDTSASHWRHFLESEFAMLALAGEIPYDRKSIIDQFIGASIQYRLEDCRMIIIPAYILLNWCSYFFDFKEKCVHVVDPLYNKDQCLMFQQIHSPNVSKVAASLVKCLDKFFDNWHPNLQEWDVKFVQPPIVDATSVETGLLTLLYMRQFDGSTFHLVNREYFCRFKKVMLYELMSLLDNPVKAPLNLTITIDD